MVRGQVRVLIAKVRYSGTVCTRISFHTTDFSSFFFFILYTVLYYVNRQGDLQIVQPVVCAFAGGDEVGRICDRCGGVGCGVRARVEVVAVVARGRAWG